MIEKRKNYHFCSFFILQTYFYRYWYINEFLEPNMMTVFIALDKCEKANGCLQVIIHKNEYITMLQTVFKYFCSKFN